MYKEITALAEILQLQNGAILGLGYLVMKNVFGRVTKSNKAVDFLAPAAVFTFELAMIIWGLSVSIRLVVGLF